MEGGNSMKKMATIVLGLMLVLTLVGCGNNAQSSDAHNAEYEEGYAAGYEAGYHDGEEQATGNEKHFAQFSGSFTATVEQDLARLLCTAGKNGCSCSLLSRQAFFASFPEGLDRRTY